MPGQVAQYDTVACYRLPGDVGSLEFIVCGLWFSVGTMSHKLFYW